MGEKVGRSGVLCEGREKAVGLQEGVSGSVVVIQYK